MGKIIKKNLLELTPKSPMAKAKRLFEIEVELKALKKEDKELRADLLKVTQELDVYSLKTGTYTISRAKRITPRVVDFETLKKSLNEEQIPIVTEETFAPQMKIVFQNLIEEGKELEGLEGLQTEYITVRLAKKEESGE